ncbi:hypothetical protein NE237_024626 [Protea cynaroides]|uniref:Uncharacterized protein n=1 Tax=Protea cynaroides TaxID=273540 RepID=A0A9Q0K0K9_9MAGN|nr:hypothetical protein NE237_024626 [Protea cynaroides]
MVVASLNIKVSISIEEGSAANYIVEFEIYFRCCLVNSCLVTYYLPSGRKLVHLHRLQNISRKRLVGAQVKMMVNFSSEVSPVNLEYITSQSLVMGVEGEVLALYLQSSQMYE